MTSKAGTTAAAIILFSGFALAQAPAPKELPTDPVMCVVCGDYTFDRKDATPAVYEGKRIYLCNLNELALIRKDPAKYVWATDVVSGKRVNKIHTPFTTDYRVRVRKVKEQGKIETWPRRFFFESAKTRDEFLRHPAKYLKEPYSV